ncbi:hypothetical protein ACFQ1S_29700, partial [Kibdelosporangium lantanae]
MPADVEFHFDNMFSGRESPVDIAVAELEFGRAGAGGRFHGDRELGYVHFDQFGRVLGDVRVLGQ